MVNGKRKGSEFERYVSKKLSLWISKGNRDDLFWRSQSSGGRYSQRKKIGKDTQNQDGDITNTSSESEWFVNNLSVECKFYKDLNFWNFITGATGGVVSFWEQTVSQANSSLKYPMAIVKQNNKPVLVLTDKTIFNILNDIFGMVPQLKITNNIRTLYVYKFENILKLNPDLFKTALKNQ